LNDLKEVYIALKRGISKTRYLKDIFDGI